MFSLSFGSFSCFVFFCKHATTRLMDLFILICYVLAFIFYQYIFVQSNFIHFSHTPSAITCTKDIRKKECKAYQVCVALSQYTSTSYNIRVCITLRKYKIRRRNSDFCRFTHFDDRITQGRRRRLVRLSLRESSFGVSSYNQRS